MIRPREAECAPDEPREAPKHAGGPNKQNLGAAPAADESFMGWLVRRSAGEEPPGLAELVRRTRLPSTSIFYLHEARDRLAEHFGVSTTTMRTIYGRTASSDPWVSAFGGQWVHINALNRVRARVCPSCLSERGYARAVWDLRLYTDCVHHARPLIDECAHCTTPVRWTRKTLGRCDHCGADHRHAPVVGSDPRVLSVCADLERVAHGEASRLIPTIGRQVPSSRTLQVLLESLLFIGTRAAAGRKARKTQSLPAVAADVRPLLVTVAKTLDGSWPEDFRRFLSAAATTFDPAAPINIQRLFPTIYKPLFIDPPASTREYHLLRPLQHEFTQYFQTRYSTAVGRIPHRVAAIQRSELSNLYVPLESVRDAFALSATKARALICDAGIVTRQVGWARGTLHIATVDIALLCKEVAAHPDLYYGPWVLSRVPEAVRRLQERTWQCEAMARLADDLTQFVSGRGFPEPDVMKLLRPGQLLSPGMVRRRLGLSAATAQQLARGGVVSVQSAPRGVATGGWVSAEEFARLEIALHSFVDRRRPSGPIISLPEALVGEGLRSAGISLGWLLQEVLSGDLGPIHVILKRHGLARIGLRRSSLKIARRKIKHSRYIRSS